MKIDGNQVRPGNVLSMNGALWVVTKTQHTQPGKGGAYMQVELKSLKEGSKRNERFRSDEKVERIFLEETPYQFLYAEGADRFVLMNQKTYEQITLGAEMFSAPISFLTEGMEVMVSFHEGEPITAELPHNVVLEVIEADPVVKGQTASASYKPAVLSNGEKVMVPAHITAGIKIIVDTRDGSYVERYKEDAS